MSGLPPSVTVVVQPPPVVAVSLQTAQGPAGPASQELPAVAVSTSRALAAADNGRVLQVSHGVTLSLPAGLPAGFSVRLLMTLPQVLAGGVLLVRAASGVRLNDVDGGEMAVRRVADSVWAPWSAWLQREAAGDSYSLTAAAASVDESFDAAPLTLFSIGVN